MRTDRLDYHLPPGQIAFHPSRVRRHCRLLRLDRSNGEVSHHRFDELPDLLAPQDLLVVNDTAVIPARLLGSREPGGGHAEVFLLEKVAQRRWRVMVRPGAKLRTGAVVTFPRHGASSFAAHVIAQESDGTRVVEFVGRGRLAEWLAHVGRVPLPPYIAREPVPQDRRDYQTVFAGRPGAVAAPTAGLHFDAVLLERLRQRKIGLAALTLHVGAGTFRPITAEKIEDHALESERYTVGARTLRRIRRQRDRGRGRVVAVGTTVVRTLETLPSLGVFDRAEATAVSGRTDLFILPGHRFQMVDALITNFHLPRSSLLALVAAFAERGGGDGIGTVLHAYDIAIRSGYRFYSYGDAMLIV